MNTRKLKQILRQVSARAGLVYEDQTADLVESWLLFAHTRLLEWWDAWHWPDICALETRPLWEEPGTRLKYFVPSEPGEAAVGQILGLHADDPRGRSSPLEIPYTEREAGTIWLEGAGLPDRLWLWYKRPAPDIAARVDDGTVAWGEGDAVYFDTPGDVYTAVGATTAGSNPVANAAAWAQVAIPAKTERWLVDAVYADWLSDQGELDKAQAVLRTARTRLEDQLAAEVSRNGGRWGVG